MCLAPRYISGMGAGPFRDARNRPSFEETPCAWSQADANRSTAAHRTVDCAARGRLAGRFGIRAVLLRRPWRELRHRRRSDAVGPFGEVANRAVGETLAQPPHDLRLVARIPGDEGEFGEFARRDGHGPRDADDPVSLPLDLVLPAGW